MAILTVPINGLFRLTIFTILCLCLPPATSIVSVLAMNLVVSNAGVKVLNGAYLPKPFTSIPAGFAATCQRMRWDPRQTWRQLAVPEAPWFEHDNGSYIYLHNDGRWWMDDPSGAGIYVCARSSDMSVVPANGWEPLTGGDPPMPTVTQTSGSTTIGSTEL